MGLDGLVLVLLLLLLLVLLCSCSWLVFVIISLSFLLASSFSLSATLLPPGDLVPNYPHDLRAEPLIKLTLGRAPVVMVDIPIA